jgi:hypothetical protein
MAEVNQHDLNTGALAERVGDQPPLAGRPWHSTIGKALVPVLLAAVFFRASNAPIHHLDTWDHWKYGQWICEHHRLPEREPFSLYSEHDQPLLDSAWLSQVAGYLIYANLGMEGIALAYGLVEAILAAVYFMAFRRVSGSLLWAVLGVVLIHVGRWSYFGVFRPQTLGEMCWACLLLASAQWLAAGEEDRRTSSVQAKSNKSLRAQFLWVPLVFALWANLHGAFVLGFLLLGMVLAGRLVECARSARHWSAGLQDRLVRGLALLLPLSLAAACLNPYGPRLLAEVANFRKYPILDQVAEWQPIPPLATYGAKALALSIILVLVTLRYSPRRFRPAEVGLLAVFGLSAWFSARMLPWWMTVCPLVLLPHGAAISARPKKGTGPLQSQVPSPFSGGLPVSRRPLAIGSWPITVGGVIAVGLLLASGSGRWLLSQHPRPVEEQFSRATPVEAEKRLEEWMARDPSQTRLRVFTSILWSDYLLWKLPPSAQLYLYTHWQLYHPRRLAHQFRLLRMSPAPPSPDGWRTILERSRFNVLALSADDGVEDLLDYVLAEERRPGSEWKIIYKGGDRRHPTEVLAIRKIDPFALALANVDAVQGCVSGLGLAPQMGNWAFLSQLPWAWND